MINIKKINGLKIACQVNDEGFVEGRKNLLFIHCAGGDHTVWKNQYTTMNKDFNIAAIDLPGHGSSEGKGEQDISRYAEWIKKIVERFGFKKPVLIGHSLGAAIALTFAIKYGEVPSGIVSVGGGAKLPVNQLILDNIRKYPASIIALSTKLSISKKNRERLTDCLASHLAKGNPEIMYYDFLACDRLNITKEIQKIKVPTLLVCGNDDKLAPPAFSQFMSNHISGAELVLIKDAGHFAMVENVKMFNKVLVDFVQSLPSENIM